MLLVSNDGDATGEDNPGDVISITEHKTAAPSSSATSKNLLLAQRVSLHYLVTRELNALQMRVV